MNPSLPSVGAHPQVAAPRSRFCCIRGAHKISLCLTDLCRRVGECFKGFLKGFTNVFKPFFYPVSGYRLHNRMPQRMQPQNGEPPVRRREGLEQPNIEVNVIEPLVAEEPSLPEWLLEFNNLSRMEKIERLNISTPQDQIRVLKELELPAGVEVPVEFRCPVTMESMAIPISDNCKTSTGERCAHVFERTAVVMIINMAQGAEVRCSVSRDAWNVDRGAQNTPLNNNVIGSIAREFTINRELQQRILHWLKEQHGLNRAGPNDLSSSPVGAVSQVSQDRLAAIAEKYPEQWPLYYSYISREDKLAFLALLPIETQIEFMNAELPAEHEVPQRFMCGITNAIMMDPVHCVCGRRNESANHVFERAAILLYLSLSENQLHCFSNPQGRLTPIQLTSAVALQEEIALWLKQQLQLNEL